jgi:elongation factor Ts
MTVSADAVKELRDKTGISMMECKKALEEAQGDVAKALEVLGVRAQATLAKKADRTLGAGAVGAYVHSTGQVGAMVVLSCETDFVGKNEEFMALARDIAMHISAMMPQDRDELMGQPFIKNPEKTIAQLVSDAAQKFGERTEVTAFGRYSVK